MEDVFLRSQRSSVVLFYGSVIKRLFYYMQQQPLNQLTASGRRLRTTYGELVAERALHGAVHFGDFDVGEAGELLLGQVVPRRGQVLAVATPVNQPKCFKNTISKFILCKFCGSLY